MVSNWSKIGFGRQMCQKVDFRSISSNFRWFEGIVRVRRRGTPSYCTQTITASLMTVWNTFWSVLMRIVRKKHDFDSGGWSDSIQAAKSCVIKGISKTQKENLWKMSKNLQKSKFSSFFLACFWTFWNVFAMFFIIFRTLRAVKSISEVTKRWRSRNPQFKNLDFSIRSAKNSGGKTMKNLKNLQKSKFSSLFLARCLIF